LGEENTGRDSERGFRSPYVLLIDPNSLEVFAPWKAILALWAMEAKSGRERLLYIGVCSKTSKVTTIRNIEFSDYHFN